jgi:hypothetical protein
MMKQPQKSDQGNKPTYLIALELIKFLIQLRSIGNACSVDSLIAVFYRPSQLCSIVEFGVVQSAFNMDKCLYGGCSLIITEPHTNQKYQVSAEE